MLFAAKILAIVNFGICLSLIKIKNRQNSPFQFFYLSLLGIVLFPMLFQSADLQIDFHPLGTLFYFSAGNYLEAVIIVFSTLMCFLLMELVWKAPITKQIFHFDNGLGFYYLPFALFSIYLVWLIYKFGFSTLASLSFLGIRESNISIHYVLLSYFSILSVFLPGYLFFVREQKTMGTIVLAVLLSYFFLMGGSRQTVVIALVFMLFLFFRDRKSDLFIWVLIFTLGFPLIETSLSVLKLLRNASDFETRLQILTQLFDREDLFAETSNDGNVRHVFHLFVAADLPEEFKSGVYLLRCLFFWMPSFLDYFSIKPADFEATMFSFAMSGNIGTMHPTYFGSIYADLGYLFPAWCLFTMVIFRVAEKFVFTSNNGYFLYGVSIYLAIMSARGALYAVLVVLFAAVLFDKLIEPNLRTIYSVTKRKRPS